MVSTIASRISPVNEKLYHQSNLLGDWKGSFSNNNQAIDFKVVSITGDTAQIEYSHNGHKEVGTATTRVDNFRNTITYEQRGTESRPANAGQKGALEF